MDCVLNIHGEEKIYPAGTPYRVIAEEYQKDYADDIVLVRFCGHLRELEKTVFRSGDLEFVTTAEPRGAQYVPQERDVFDGDGGQHAVPGHACVCAGIPSGRDFTVNFHRDRALVPAEHSWLQELKEKMQELISRDEPIVKHNLNLQEAIDFFRGDRPSG